MKWTIFVLLPAILAGVAWADDNTATLTLEGHKFTPAEIRVKANTPTTVTIINKDDATEEFDSNALKIEKVVAGHATGTMRLRPLAPGRYPFMGEFHAETARGVVIAE